MSDFYGMMQEVASDLLTEFGASGKLEKARREIPNSSKPWEFGDLVTPETYDITGAAVPVTDREDQKLLDSIGAYTDARWILVSSKDLAKEVKPNDFVMLVGKKWKIIKSTAIQPADIVVMYSCLGVC